MVERNAEGETKPIIPLKWRTTNLGTVSYLELFGEADIRSALRRIIVGPHAHLHERAESLRSYVRSLEIDLKVCESKTPYRGI